MEQEAEDPKPDREERKEDRRDSGGGSSGLLVGKISPAVLSASFLAVVLLFIAAAIIALTTDLTDKQQAVYQGIFTVAAAVIGAVFGVKIQEPQTEKAEERGRRRLSEAKAVAIDEIAKGTDPGKPARGRDAAPGTEDLVARVSKAFDDVAEDD